jgi:hypothetical protein
MNQCFVERIKARSTINDQFLPPVTKREPSSRKKIYRPNYIINGRNWFVAAVRRAIFCVISTLDAKNSEFSSFD